MGSVATDEPNAVSVSLHDLESANVSLETLEEAFGPASLGIIIVRDLPEEFVQMRARLLSYSSYLASLPQEELAKVEIPASRYNVGWSCGKEKLDNGMFDTFKGSYYVQPVHNAELEAKARKLFPNNIEMTSPNVWPDEKVLPGFETLFEKLCGLIVDVAGLVARSCDRYGVAKLEGYRDGTLEEIVRGSVSTKARLLHYFPPPPTESTPAPEAESSSSDDAWCGVHTDLGALTGLTSNMFIDEAAHPPTTSTSLVENLLPPLPELPKHPDPKAGLWIISRSGKPTQVHIPRDCLAFQTGQALQLLTRGKFRAVPHFVRGPKGGVEGRKIARNTLAVFTQPNLWEVVDEGEGLDFAGLAEKIFGKTY